MKSLRNTDFLKSVLRKDSKLAFDFDLKNIPAFELPPAIHKSCASALHLCIELLIGGG